MKANNKSRFASLGKDFLTYGLMSAISRMTGFLLLPIFTRVFSADKYGIIDIIATFTSLLTILISLSFPGAIQRYFFEFDQKEQIKSLFSTLLAISATVGLTLLIAGSLLSQNISHLILGDPQYAQLIILGVLGALFTGLSNISLAVLRMERRIVLYNSINLVHSLSYALLALYLVFVQSIGLLGLLLALAIAGALKFSLALSYTRPFLTKKFSYPLLKRALKYSLPILPALLVNWINAQTDRLILLTFLGLSSVGIFGAAARIAVLIRLFSTVFQKSWTPYAMLLIKIPVTERNNFYRRALNYYAGSFACLGLALTAISPEIFAILVSEEYRSGYIIIPWIVGATILHVAGSMTGLGVLIGEKTYANSVAAWSGAILNLLLAVALIPNFGIWGAAIGTFVAELAFTTILWHFTIRYSDIRFDSKVLLTVLTCYVTTAILTLSVAETMESPLLSLIIRLALLAGAMIVIATQTIDEPAQRAIRATIK
jgi:O-antigen/teichoic acid export membrane protein